MKVGTAILSFAALGLIAASVCCAATNAAPTQSSSRSSLMSKNSSNSGVLTEEELASLANKWTDEKNSSHTVTMGVHISAKTFDPKKDKSQMRKFAKSGKVPFVLLADVIEQKTDNGKTSQRRILDQKVYFYLLDSDGKVAKKDSEGLNSLCRS